MKKVDAMNLVDVKEKLMSIVTEILEVDRSVIEGKEDVNLFKELDVDSLLALEIIANVETKYNIKIEDEEIETLVSFNKMLEMVKNKLNIK
ncbi:MAG: hypothetical protein A2W19_13340 [Spirochaetes bacterium RBG_16_49_21]|nr:MAG: hypothetical protein A2W19_13340 [Spirochaetes bacterium RBG_16_49_21]